VTSDPCCHGGVEPEHIPGLSGLDVSGRPLCSCSKTGGADVVYRAALKGVECWMRNHLGEARALPMRRWMGGPASSAADRLADERIADLCPRPMIMDLGCGPGRYTALLGNRGLTPLGVDTSAMAVALTRERGGRAIQRDLFDRLPAEGRWDHILLADGNVGIGGDPVRVLQRAGELLTAGGSVIVELDGSQAAMVHEQIRWETKDYTGHWFPWSRVGPASVGAIAATAALRVVRLAMFTARVVAVLESATVC